MPTDIDLDTDGFDELLVDLEELEEKGTTDAAYSVGSNADYGSILEFGRGPIQAPDDSALKFEDEAGNEILRQRVSGHPPYPWFRPAIREARLDIETFMRTNIQKTPNQAQTARQLVFWVAASLERQMTKNVSAMSATGRSPGTHPKHPKRDTGNLAASIQATKIQ